jgi:ketosteroid isomerase-like protein
MNDTATNPIDRLYQALSAGDLKAARACLTTDARIKHCFESSEHTADSIHRGWQGFVTHFGERTVTQVRRQPTPEGFVQQHLLTVRTSDGKQRSWSICIVVRIEGQRIARLDEYMDRQSNLSPAAP